MDNKISQFIRQKNMTQENLAQKVGVSRAYINRIIKGRINPTVPLGIRIAKALEIQVEDLFIIE
jgi:putative transcriptional regulator